MEVKPGYKRTEVGVIPKEWEAKRLGDLASVSAGGTPSRTNTHYWNGDIPWVTTTEVDFCTIDRAEQFITEEGLKNSAAKLLPRGTLLMALYGQGKTRGKVGILGIDAATNQACAAIAPNRSVSPEFIFHFLSSQYESIRKLSNTGNQENLNGAIVRSISVLLPPPEEQRAIAAALGDVDALLGGLEKLIAKKRDLKQAAMQQLLTGQQRLPGFHGEWEMKRLGDLGAWKGGATPSMSNSAYWTAGDIPWASSGDIKTNVLTETGKTITKTAVKECSTTLIQPGAILIVTRSGILRRFLPVATNAVAVAINQDIKASVPDANVSAGFMLQALVHEGPNILASCLKSGTTVESIEYVWLKRFEIAIPTFHEQTAIAAVLSDMDAELASLEARLAKTRLLKQGMMQELLTGRIRLV
jgi:type I restriction enzyme S subunit